MNIQKAFKIKKNSYLNCSSLEGPKKYYGFCEFISSMYSRDNIDICLEDIDKIKTGLLNETFIDGSVFGVSINKNKVVSENLLTCEVYPDELSFEEFNELFLMWATHCKKEYF